MCGLQGCILLGQRAAAMTHARRNKVAEWRDSHRKRFPVSTIAPAGK
jgi:hypothetical protein